METTLLILIVLFFFVAIGLLAHAAYVIQKVCKDHHLINLKELDTASVCAFIPLVQLHF